MPFWRRRGLGEWVPLAPGMLLARFWDSFTRSPVASWDLQGGKMEKKGISIPRARVGGSAGACTAPRFAALPLPRWLFFIFVSVLKPGLFLGN